MLPVMRIISCFVLSAALLLRVMHGGFGLASYFSESQSLACAHVVPHCIVQVVFLQYVCASPGCILHTCGSRMRVERAILWIRTSGRGRGL